MTEHKKNQFYSNTNSGQGYTSTEQMFANAHLLDEESILIGQRPCVALMMEAHNRIMDLKDGKPNVHISEENVEVINDVMGYEIMRALHRKLENDYLTDTFNKKG
jgi:hypothetical protein